MSLPRTFEGIHTSLTIERRTAHVVILTIAGRDVGEHGDAPFTVLEEELAGGPYTLFVDAHRTKGASIDVSDAWARWLRSHRERLHHIHMLTGSRFVQLTADFVRRFAELGDSMSIYTDRAAFDEVLSTAVAA